MVGAGIFLFLQALLARMPACPPTRSPTACPLATLCLPASPSSDHCGRGAGLLLDLLSFNTRVVTSLPAPCCPLPAPQIIVGVVLGVEFSESAGTILPKPVARGVLAVICESDLSYYVVAEASPAACSSARQGLACSRRLREWCGEPAIVLVCWGFILLTSGDAAGYPPPFMSSTLLQGAAG